MNLRKKPHACHTSIIHTFTLQRAYLLKYTQIYTTQQQADEHTEFLLTFHCMRLEQQTLSGLHLICPKHSTYSEASRGLDVSRRAHSTEHNHFWRCTAARCPFQLSRHFCMLQGALIAATECILCFFSVAKVILRFSMWGLESDFVQSILLLRSMKMI